MEQMKLYAGLDMHTETTTGTIKDEKGNPIRVMKVDTTKQGIRQLFKRLKKKNIKAVFEASRNWSYYAELIKPYCEEVIMAHPLRVRAIASARIKTDEIDSNILADLVRADLIPESYMPSMDIVELRETLRYRAFLSRQRAGFKIKVRNILSREGKKCEFTNITAKKARLWINNLELKELNRRELGYILSLIDNLSSEIEKHDQIIEKEQHKYPEVDILKSIVGIDTFSALLIIAEVGDFTRFHTPQQLAAYSGLIPSTYQSGEGCYQGRITKQGSKWLRWILTQCAHASVKSSKSHRLKRFYLRIQKKRGTQKAITATARKTLTIIWHLLNKNEYYAY